MSDTNSATRLHRQVEVADRADSMSRPERERYLRRNRWRRSTGNTWQDSDGRRFALGAAVREQLSPDMRTEERRKGPPFASNSSRRPLRPNQPMTYTDDQLERKVQKSASVFAMGSLVDQPVAQFLSPACSTLVFWGGRGVGRGVRVLLA
jgi:hypothetical protein